jgi:hypothetical protein
MAYRDFKMKDLEDKFGIQEVGTDLFIPSTIKQIEPSEKLKSDIKDAKLINLSTEKAISERLVAPILAEIRRNNDDFQIFSGEIITGDKKLGLNGEIDFIFAKTPITTKPNTPIFCVTESKIGRVIEAFPQAIAQMLGVREFNKSHDKDVVTIHGIVTDGKTWRILKLLNQNALVDQTDYSTENLPLLLGVFQEIINFYKK